MLELAIGVIGLLELVLVPFMGGSVYAYGLAGRVCDCAAVGDGGRVPAAADDFDGGDAAGDCAVCGGFAAGRVVAGVLLRRQHAGGGVRVPAGGVLSAARA